MKECTCQCRNCDCETIECHECGKASWELVRHREDGLMRAYCWNCDVAIGIFSPTRVNPRPDKKQPCGRYHPLPCGVDVDCAED